MELHKDTTQDRVKKYEDITFVKVYPENTSEIRYYMNYGFGIELIFYESVLNTKIPLYFIVDGTKNEVGFCLVYHYNDEYVYFTPEITYYETFTNMCRLFNDDPIETSTKILKAFMDIKFQDKFTQKILSRNFNIKIPYLIINFLYGMNYIIDLIPESVKEMFFDNRKISLYDLSMFENLTYIEGNFNYVDEEFKKRKNITIKNL